MMRYLLLLLIMLPMTSWVFSSFIQAQTLNQRVMKKINEYRASYGITTLAYEPKAKKTNVQMLKYMIETSTIPLDHSQRLPTSFPKTFETFTDRVNYVNDSTYICIGENLCIFVDLKTDEERAEYIVELWKNSPPHNALLLSLRYTGMYVGNQLSNQIIIDDSYYYGSIRYVVLTLYK